jgi:hypothetical protein
MALAPSVGTKAIIARSTICSASKISVAYSTSAGAIANHRRPVTTAHYYDICKAWSSSSHIFAPRTRGTLRPDIYRSDQCVLHWRAATHDLMPFFKRLSSSTTSTSFRSPIHPSRSLRTESASQLHLSGLAWPMCSTICPPPPRSKKTLIVSTCCCVGCLLWQTFTGTLYGDNCSDYGCRWG